MSVFLLYGKSKTPVSRSQWCCADFIFYRKTVRYQNSEAISLDTVMGAAVSLGIYNTYEEAFANAVGKKKIRYMRNL